MNLPNMLEFGKKEHFARGDVGRCPDDGTCHHLCVGFYCFRVEACGPMTGMYNNNLWPDEIVKTWGTPPYLRWKLGDKVVRKS